MTRNQLRERQRIIIGQLSELSKDGWRHAKPGDYQPLEHELREIEAKIEAKLRQRGAR